MRNSKFSRIDKIAKTDVVCVVVVSNCVHAVLIRHRLAVHIIMLLADSV